MKLSWSALFAVAAALFNVTLSAQDLRYYSTELDPDPPAMSPIQLASFNNGALLEAAELNTNPTCGSDVVCDTCVCDTLLNNMQLSMGGSTFKSLGDSALPAGPGAGLQNNAGVVGGLNTSFGLGSSNIRGQIGGSAGAYDLKGRDTAAPASSELLAFVTAGVYKRSDILNGDRMSWGMVYDQMFDRNYGIGANRLYVGQFRGIGGYALDTRNEVGGWGTIRTNSDTATLPAATTVFAATQMNAFWRHNWDYGASTMAYIGVYDKSNTGSWTFGFNGTAPLSDKWSLYGNFVMMMPSSKTGIVGSNEEQWYSTFGLTYYYGGRSVSPNISGNRTNPLLQVADPSVLQITR